MAAVDTSKIRKARTHKAIAKIMTKFGGKLDFKITFESLNEGSKFDHDVFFGLQKLLSTRSKNNKLKGYSSEVAHAVTDILTSVEEDKLAIGDVFSGLNTIIKKINFFT